MIQKFWKWYKDNLALNQTIVAVLFGWQLLHLYWLTTHVAADRLLGYPLFSPSESYQFFLIIADYFEVPALISGTLLYLHSIGEGSLKKKVLYIILINSQWLHLFWITDEFVVERFRTEVVTVLPLWLAWVAILIDYLELPVIYDTIKSVLRRGLKKSQLAS